MVHNILYSSFAPVFFFFTIPVLDFFTVFVYRIKNNISPTTGGTDHISHRLLATGIDIKNVLIIFIINLTIFSLIASSIIFKNFSDLIIIFYFIFVILMYLKFSRMDIIK